MGYNIAALVVTYNSEKWIGGCVESLLESSVRFNHIVIIDNNSQDNTETIVQNIKSKSVNIVFKNLFQNSGFAKANNIGMGICVELGVDWVLLLNPDAKIEKDGIRIALDSVADDLEVACVGGLELKYDSDEYSKFTMTHSYNAFSCNGDIVEVDGKEGSQICGAFLLLRTNAVEKIGLFDPIFHMYFEESDFFRRTRRVGWKIVLNKNVKYHHAVAKSYGEKNDDKRYMAFEKYIDYTKSEFIFILTKPNWFFFFNCLNVIFKKFLKDAIVYMYSPKYYFSSIMLIKDISISECYRKWSRDHNSKAEYYVHSMNYKGNNFIT